MPLVRKKHFEKCVKDCLKLKENRFKKKKTATRVKEVRFSVRVDGPEPLSFTAEVEFVTFYYVSSLIHMSGKHRLPRKCQ